MKEMKCHNPKCNYICIVRNGAGKGLKKKMKYHLKTRCGKGKYEAKL